MRIFELSLRGYELPNFKVGRQLSIAHGDNS